MKTFPSNLIYWNVLPGSTMMVIQEHKILEIDHQVSDSIRSSHSK